MKHLSSISAHFLKYAMWAGLYQRTSFIAALMASTMGGTTIQSLSSVNFTERLVLLSVRLSVIAGFGDFNIPIKLDSSRAEIGGIRSIGVMKGTMRPRKVLSRGGARNSLRQTRRSITWRNEGSPASPRWPSSSSSHRFPFWVVGSRPA